MLNDVSNGINSLKERVMLSSRLSSRRSEVAMYTCRDLVESVPFFQDKSRSFVISTVTKLQSRVYMRGELITRQGDISDEMYFVSEGEIDVEINGEPRIHLSKVARAGDGQAQGRMKENVN